MIRKKNRFFTLIFSTMFGAGQMYMGFMKLGVSLMSLTAAVIFFGSWLNIGPILYTLPVIWFFSFFDSINKMTLPDIVFEKLEDHYIFQLNTNNIEIKKLLKKYETVIAVLLILVGVTAIGNNIFEYMENYMSSLYDNNRELYYIIHGIRWNAGRMIFAVLIIVIGVKMIMGKKKELDIDNSQQTPIEVLTLEVHNDEIKENISNENP